MWPQQTRSPECKRAASQTCNVERKESNSPLSPHGPPLPHGRDPSPHDSRPVFLLAAAFVCFNNSKNSKSKWKEPAYLSFPIVYLFHGKLILRSPVTGSSLGSTARPAWLWARLPGLPGLSGLTLGTTGGPFNLPVIPMIQYCLCLKHLCCFLSLPACPSTSFFHVFFSLFSLFMPYSQILKLAQRRASETAALFLSLPVCKCVTS